MCCELNVFVTTNGNKRQKYKRQNVMPIIAKTNGNFWLNKKDFVAQSNGNYLRMFFEPNDTILYNLFQAKKVPLFMSELFL